MPYKIAGVDVRKKVLMVVVIDAATPEEKTERRRFATMPSEMRRLSVWLREQGGEEAVGIHGPILAIGVVGVGAVHAFTSGTRIFESCSARTQA
jgi:hypothetical protein